MALIEKLKQELASEQEKRLSGVIVPPGGSGLSRESVCVPKKTTVGKFIIRATSLEKLKEAKETSKRGVNSKVPWEAHSQAVYRRSV